jgi:hypothetical protein
MENKKNLENIFGRKSIEKTEDNDYEYGGIRMATYSVTINMGRRSEPICCYYCGCEIDGRPYKGDRSDSENYCDKDCYNKELDSKN